MCKYASNLLQMSR